MKTTNDLTVGKVNKKLILFALPVMLGNIFQQFYNIADTAIAGHLLGDSALSAIGATTSLCALVTTFAFGLNGGFGIILARAFGEKNMKKVKRIFAKMISINVVISVLVAIIAIFFTKPILHLIKTPSADFSGAYSYMIVLLVCIFATMLFNLQSTALSAVGDSKTPVYFLIIATVLNLILDYVFIKFLGFGVAGTAWATIIAQLFSALLCFILILKKFSVFKISKADFAFNKSLLKSMLSAGFTMAFMNSIFSIGSVIMQSGINSLGSSIIAANLASRKISQVFMQPLVTIGTSCQTFVSQNYGAGNLKRIKESIKWATVYSLVISIISFFVLFFLGGFLTKIMTGSASEEVIKNSALYLKINAPFYFVLGMLFTLRFSIQSINSRIPPLISSTIELATKVIATFWLIPKIGYIGVCVAEPISWFIGAIYLVFAFKVAYKKAVSYFENKNTD